MPRSLSQLRADAQSIFQAGLDAVDARNAVSRHLSLDSNGEVLSIDASIRLPLSRFDRIFVIGGGKAAAPMAVAVEEIVGLRHPPQGLVNVKYGHTSPKPRFIALHECAHPIPDRAGVAGVRAMERVLE
jgi:glycerate 2-kinase